MPFLYLSVGVCDGRRGAKNNIGWNVILEYIPSLPN